MTTISLAAPRGIRARGALSTALRALRQAATLTPDDEPRARRLVAGAEIAAALGSWEEATAMLADARERSGSQLLEAQTTRVLARVEMLRGLPAAGSRFGTSTASPDKCSRTWMYAAKKR